MTGRPSSSEGAESGPARDPLRVRWLGRVAYDEAWDLQQRLFEGSAQHLLLLEHPAVYTLGVRADIANLGSAGDHAQVVRVNRGGDVTYHGPGQLVGYPIVDVATRRGGGMADTAAYVELLEQGLIAAVRGLGLASVGQRRGYPGVWVEPGTERERKLAAIGVRLSRGRSMHGFALNVDVDAAAFDEIVPCGIADRGVTSLAAEGIAIDMADVVDAVVSELGPRLGPGRRIERADVAQHVRPDDLAPFTRGEGPGDPIRPGSAPPAATSEVPVRMRRRLDAAGVGDGLALTERKPNWMRVKLNTGPEYRRLKAVSTELDLVTVCEEAGCPNIYECWNEGTATFMLLGERCTRACGFCLVDTQKPVDVDLSEPTRVADAVERLGLDFAVLTMVARDDLADGGAAVVAATVAEIRSRSADVGIEVLISDLRGSSVDLATVAAARPDVLNHNIETVARLQRAVRPSAGYARSLTVLARAKAHELVTKSGIIVGMGESFDEVTATLADLAAVGVDIVTIGQYLRPTSNHLPVDRWVTPDEFDAYAEAGAELGIAHIESSPLTRSSHHAGTAARSVGAARR